MVPTRGTRDHEDASDKDGEGPAVGALFTALTVATTLSPAGPSFAADAKPNIGIVVPGPNAYLDPWRAAAADASKASDINATFQVSPTEAFNLAQENAPLDSLVARDDVGFALFSGNDYLWDSGVAEPGGLDLR